MSVAKDAATPTSQKLCFVTIGATASFQSLIKAVLDVKFVSTLRTAGYSELRVQYGQEGKPTFEEFLSANGTAGSSPSESFVEGVLVSGFDFKMDGLASDMREAKGGIGEHVEGVVVSHAGQYYSTWVSTGKLTANPRYGLHTRSLPSQYTFDRSSKCYTSGQSPARAG